MNSSEVKHYLAAYADGELPQDLRERVEAHLAADPGSQSAVAAWRALRQAACSALRSETLPPELRARLIAQLRRRPDAIRARRIWTLFTLASVAAVLAVMGVVGWWLGRPGGVPPERPPTVVALDRLLQIYRNCALRHQHDPFGLRGRSHSEVVAALRDKTDPRLASYTPDLSAAGYELSGLCRCPLAEGAVTVHAHYARKAGDHASGPRLEDVVSFFLVACPVALDGCTDTISPEGCRFQHPERQYAVARLEDGLTVIKWDESGCSFAVCSAQTPAELVDLADSVSVAAGPPLPPNALARLPHPRVWPPTGAAFGLPVAALSLARRSDSRPWGPNRDRKGASIGSEPLP